MLQSTENATKVVLPGGAFYPQDIYVKPFNVLQVKTLSKIALTNDPIQLINLVGECINYDVKELYQDDFWYLLHWLRINSFMDFPHIIPWQCPACEYKNNTPLTPETLTYDEIKEDYVDGEMRMKFDNFPEGLYIRPQKVKDDITSRNFMKKKLIKESDMARAAIIMDLLLLTNPKNNMNLEELYKLYNEGKFTNDDFNAIAMFKKEYAWGVTDVARMKCDKCHEEVDVEYSFSLASFLPSNNDRSNFRKRILAGVPSTPTDTTVG